MKVKTITITWQCSMCAHMRDSCHPQRPLGYELLEVSAKSTAAQIRDAIIAKHREIAPQCPAAAAGRLPDRVEVTWLLRMVQ